MSMSTHVVGLVPPDATYERMQDVWLACESAGIPVPHEVEKFFDYKKPDGKGIEIRVVASKYHEEGREGLEVELSKLPPQVKIIRFYNSY